MILKSFDYSRVVQLCTLARPEGQLFLPMAAAKLAQRYSFQKVPTLEQLVAHNQTYTFSIGAFGEYGIHDLTIYSNGIIITAGVNTSVIEAMMADLFAWAES